jgi:hypothetical protein
MKPNQFPQPVHLDPLHAHVLNLALGEGRARMHEGPSLRGEAEGLVWSVVQRISLADPTAISFADPRAIT